MSSGKNIGGKEKKSELGKPIRANRGDGAGVSIKGKWETNETICESSKGSQSRDKFRVTKLKSGHICVNS